MGYMDRLTIIMWLRNNPLPLLLNIDVRLLMLLDIAVLKRKKWNRLPDFVIKRVNVRAKVNTIQALYINIW